MSLNLETERDRRMTDPPSRPGLTRRALTRSLATLPLTLLGCASSDTVQADMPYHHTANGFRNPSGSPMYKNGIRNVEY